MRAAEILRDSLGRVIGAITKVVLGAPLLRTVIRIIPTPIRRQIPRWGRRLRRIELESGPYPGTPRALAASPLPATAIPYGYEIGERRGVGIFDVEQRRPTRFPRRRPDGAGGRTLERRFPAGAHMARTARCDPARDADGFRRMVQRVLVIDATRSTFADAETQTRLLHAAAACGTPVAEDADTLTHLLRDDEARHRAAWTQWRAARPEVADVPVTVVIATRRPEMVARWAPQIAAQTHRNLRVSVALHGSVFDAVDDDAIRAALGEVPVTISRCGDDAVLGELLRVATAASASRDDVSRDDANGDDLNRADLNSADGNGADGNELILKWDDDDLYSTEHVADMVRTWDTTGAMLVGKACDYVYLSGPDVTVRRIQAARESISRTMAGGTLAISRRDLAAVGGWDEVRSGVDVGLIAKVQEAGGIAYRAMGYGYMMIREPAGAGHTWAVDDAHFLADINPRRPGMALEWAAIDAPRPPLPP